MLFQLILNANLTVGTKAKNTGICQYHNYAESQDCGNNTCMINVHVVCVDTIVILNGYITIHRIHVIVQVT